MLRIDDRMHSKHLRQIPDNTKHRPTVIKALGLCRDPKQNREDLDILLTKALSRFHARNFYLHVKLFRHAGNWRLMFIDPSNNQVLWMDCKTNNLTWYPLYGNGQYPSIL